MNGYTLPYKAERYARSEHYSEIGHGSISRNRQASESGYGVRTIGDVNRDVSSRMMAAASDSPPIIPKRDYDSHSSTSGRQHESRMAAMDISGDLGENPDSDSMTPPNARRTIPADALVPYGMPPGGPPFPGDGHFPPMGHPMMGPPPGAMMPPMRPPPHDEMMRPMMPHPPHMPPPHWMGGGPHLPPPPDPRMSGMYADPGLLFTPHGPIMPGELPEAKKRKKGKKDKKELQRTRSMDHGIFGMQPTPIFPPPMGRMGPPMENPYGYMGPPPNQFPFADPFAPPFPPSGMHAPLHQHSRPPTEVGYGGPPPGSIIMGQPPLSRETRGSELLMNGMLEGGAPAKTGTMVSDSLSNPSDKKLTEKGYKKNACREICCDSGLSIVMWVIIGVILLGLIIGLSLGLTIV